MTSGGGQGMTAPSKGAPARRHGDAGDKGAPRRRAKPSKPNLPADLAKPASPTSQVFPSQAFPSTPSIRSSMDAFEVGSNCSSEKTLTTERQQLRPTRGDAESARKRNLATQEQQEAEKNMREFLKVVKPEWSMITSNGKSNVHRVMMKLKDIGVTDISELMRRVRANTLNMHLSDAEYLTFGEETLQALRSVGNCVRALEHLKEPHYRQMGCFAPVPVLLTKSYVQQWGQKPSSASSGSRPAKTGRRPASSSSSGGARTCTVGGAWRLSDELDDQDDGRPHTANGPSHRRRAEGDRQEGHPGGAFLHVGTGRGGAATSSMRRSSSAPQRSRNASEAAAPSRDRPRLRYAKSTTATANIAWAASRCARSSPGNRPRSATNALANTAPADSSRYPVANLREGNCGSRSGSASASANDDDALDSEAALVEVGTPQTEMEAERFQQQLATSLRAYPRVAYWRPVATEPEILAEAGVTGAWEELPGETLIVARAADQVLKEKQALEEKEFMLLQMRREGQHSATRKVIASNVRCRLREAAASDRKKEADVHLRSARIRKNLAEMKSRRKELRDVRRKAEAALLDAPPPPKEDRYDGLRSRFAGSRCERVAE